MVAAWVAAAAPTVWQSHAALARGRPAPAAEGAAAHAEAGLLAIRGAAAERGAAEKPANAWRPSAAGGADHACQHKCVGLRCPEGWTTAPKRDADGACKCICARLEDDTAWDRERREQQAKLEAAKPERDPLHGPRDHAET